jgi:hypothetical protein
MPNFPSPDRFAVRRGRPVHRWMYAFRRANALAANAFTCYGAYNTVIGMFILLEASGTMPMGAPQGFTILGYFNCSFAFVSLVLLVAALCRNVVLSGIIIPIQKGPRRGLIRMALAIGMW